MKYFNKVTAGDKLIRICSAKYDYRFIIKCVITSVPGTVITGFLWGFANPVN